MKTIKPVLLAALGALAVIAFSPVQAATNVASGLLWHVPEATSQNAIPANIPVRTADVTFDVNSPFNFNASSTTVGTWLASSSAFNIHENTAGTLASLMDNGTAGTFVEFAGNVTVTNGQTFTVTHDDGLTLTIGALTVVNVPGPTGPITTTVTYTGPSGNLPFQLVYGECCGGSAVLQVALPFTAAPIPEPESYAMLLAGLGLLGFMARRRKQNAA